MQPRVARITLRIVGAVVLLCAAFGLFYNSVSFIAVASGAADTIDPESPMPYFRSAFYALSAICVICYLALVWCGIQFVRARPDLWALFSIVLVVEVLSYLTAGWLWRNPTLGVSVAAATGISQGGMMPQVFILLPLWGPIAVWFAKRSLAKV
jgi:hypothetical protein